MARSIDIWPSLVQGGMDHEAGFIDLVFGWCQGLAVLVDQDQVAGIDQTKMNGIWILLGLRSGMAILQGG